MNYQNQLVMFRSAVFLVLLSISLTVYTQPLSKSQQRYLRKKMHLVSTGDAFQTSRWKPLRKQMVGKRIVAIGEFTHGAREVFQVRNSLIRYLHKELGFEVILLESGMGELIHINVDRSGLSPTAMTRALMGPWQTDSFRELMGYVQENDLLLAGFDVQRSGRSFREVLNEKALSELDGPTRFDDLEDRYTQATRLLRGQLPYDSVAMVTVPLIDDYYRLEDLLAGIERNDSEWLLLRRTLINRAIYLQYMSDFKQDRDWHKRWAARDQAMADNVLWLSEKLFPEKKIIIIAHNFHIAKYNEAELVMGEILQKQLSDTYYALGIFAAQGIFANNSRKSTLMSPADSERTDIKHLISDRSGSAYYLPLPPQQDKKNSWLFEEMVSNDTFISLNGKSTLAPARHFNGLLLLRSVSPPIYLE